MRNTWDGAEPSFTGDGDAAETSFAMSDVHWRNSSSGGEQSVGDGAVAESAFNMSDDQRSASFDTSAQRTQV